MVGLVTVTMEIELLQKTVMEPESKWEKVFKEICRPFEPFAQYCIVERKSGEVHYQILAMG